MGVRDLLKNLVGGAGADELLEPLLAAQGIDAGRIDYHPESKHLVLSLKIHGTIKYTIIPTGRTLTRPQICELIMGHGQPESPPAVVPPEHAKPPPKNSSPAAP